MFRARYVMLVALLTLIAIGTLFGQARDFDPPTPAERLEELTGYRPEVEREEYRVYQPRRFRNPLMDDDMSEDEGLLGRSPFVVYEMGDGPLGFWQDSDSRLSIRLPDYAGFDNQSRSYRAHSDTYEPVLNLTQAAVNFDFETPRYLSVPQPDGSARNYWYMMFTAANYEPYPKDVSLDFRIKTMAQDIFPDPELPEQYQEQLNEQLLAQFARHSFYGPEITPEQVLEMNEMLLAQFSGYGPDELEQMSQGQRNRIVGEIREEMLRGIRQSLAINYLSYPDRMLLDRIADREARWRFDEAGRSYNPLVPAHHLMLRRKLMPRDDASHIGYSYPDIVLEDVVSENAYIVTPIYRGPNEDPTFQVKICPADGSAPTIREPASLEEIDRAGLGEDGYIHLSPEVAYDPEEGMTDHIRLRFVQAIRRYWPRYHIGDRVDQYGFRLPSGHPAYERGIQIHSYHTMKKLHGAEYLDLEVQGGRVTGGDVPEGMEPAFEGMNVEDGVLTVEDEGLPKINGKRLIATPADQLVTILNTCFHWRFELGKGEESPNIWEHIEENVETVLELTDYGSGDDDDVTEPLIRDVVSRLLRIYEGDKGDFARDDLPHMLIFDIENYVLHSSRVAFMEAHGEETRILGNEHDFNFIWDAQFFPVVCRIKHPTPRRYAPGQHILRNYSLPTAPRWTMPEQLDWGEYLYREIGEEEPSHSYTVSGVILEPHEYSPDAPRANRLPPETNRYGAEVPSGGDVEHTYGGLIRDGGSILELNEEIEPYFDTDWGRDEAGQGRPVKRVDTYGRPLQAGFRVYRVGDRVTPMEWKAYGSLLPVNLLRDWAATGGYDPERDYLRSGDLLVGQPRLVLAEFRYQEEQMPSGEIALWPLGHDVEGAQEIHVDERDGTYWRNGFRLDAAGDYDAILYEELGPQGQNRFEELLRNTLDKAELREASTRAGRSFLKLVPEMDRYGAPVDFVHPITGEKIPQRVDVLPSGDQIGEVLRDDAGNTVFATAYKKLPRYLYEFEYEAISRDEAREVEPELYEGDLFDLSRFNEDRKEGIDEHQIEEYWSQPRAVSGGMDSLIGQPKVTSVPTLEPARINENFEPDEYIVIDRQNVERIVPALSQREVQLMDDDALRVDPMHAFDRIEVNDLSLIHRVTSLDPLEDEHDPSIRGRNAVLYGTIQDDPMPNHILFRVQREVIPTVAEGVAVFGELDPQWDFMNVYVYGIRGPFRRSGMETTSPDRQVDSALGTPRGVTLYDHTPRLERENWVLQLRFERLGSPLTRQMQSVRFIRRYWYHDTMDTDPDDRVIPVRD